MDYFDCTYFDGAYFDVDPSCGAVASGGHGPRGPRRIPAPAPPFDEDEDELIMVRLL